LMASNFVIPSDVAVGGNINFSNSTTKPFKFWITLLLRQ
jgi:hypothetical protein